MLLQGMENLILLLELKKVEKKNFGMNEIFPQPYISIKLRNYSINRLYVRFCKDSKLLRQDSNLFCFNFSTSMNRTKVLMPIKKPDELKSPRNALQEAIDRILLPKKTELQLKADEFEDKIIMDDIHRLEHLDKGIILFFYSNLSITKIQEFPDGSFMVENYQNTKIPHTEYKSVGDDLNEKWVKKDALSMVKRLSYNYEG